MHQSFEPPTPPRACLGETGIITSYSPACVSLGGGANTRFHFFVAWFSDGSKLSGGGREQTTLSRLKSRPTSLWMSAGFTFNLSVVEFLHCLVIWTFDLNYLRSSHSRFLLLEMLFKVWWEPEDRRKAVTANSTLWVVQLSTKGQGLHSVFLAWCPGHTECMSPPCLRWGGVGMGVSNDWCIRNNIMEDQTQLPCSDK